MEATMKRILLTAAAAASGLIIVSAAQAQETTIIREAPATVGVARDEGILPSQRPAFRAYVVEQDIPEFVVGDEIVVGRVLPDAGVTFYDVPQQFGATAYRYTVINHRTVLVDPRTRQVMQILD